MDLTGTARGTENLRYGVSILNDCKYSSDIKDNEMRLTLVNSPIYADHFADQRHATAEVMDQSIQELGYKIVPHAGDWRDAGIVKKACVINTRVIQVAAIYHKGPLPKSFCGIRIECNNVIATVFKKAEDGDGHILRCYETSGFATEAVIKIPMRGRKWTASFGKCEIKTFCIPENADEAIPEKNLLEMQNE